jgi:hypothetical protein
MVVWRHDATHFIAPGNTSTALSGNGRPPAPRFAFVGDYRKLGNISHLIVLDLRPLGPKHLLRELDTQHLGASPDDFANPLLITFEKRQFKIIRDQLWRFNDDLSALP